MKNALKNQIRRLTQKLEKLEKLSSRISTFRLFDVVLAVLLIFLGARTGNAWLFYGIIILGVASFVILVTRHRKIDDWIEKMKGWIEIRKQHLAKMNLEWDEIPEANPQEDYEHHPFARDLDIVGKHSILQLINTAVYKGGLAQLEQWLTSQNIHLSKLKKRQSLIKELKPMAHFRDRLRLYAALARKQRKEHDWTMDELLVWLRSTEQDNYTKPLAILATLSAVNITLLVLYIAGIVDPYVIFTAIVYFLVYNYYGDLTSGIFDEAQQINKLLSQFREVLLYLEDYPYKKGSRLESFCAVFTNDRQLPSTFLKRIIRLASAASSQSSELTWALLNAVVPWDMYFAKKLNAYKEELEPKLSVWLDHFYRLEALNSIANYAWLNDEYIFTLPSESSKQPIIKAEQLGHPLIPKNRKVTNSVAVDDIGDILLITGSNMSGKSTFLRTLGINLCLCYAGAPVNARSFRTIPFRLFSSINVTDSLDEGLSHFYAEVKRLRKMLEALNKVDKYPLFYMVDEIYRGTNNKERLIGSDAFLKEVAGHSGVGLVSTHDLELAQLENEIESLTNYHFEETIEDGKMRFEYKLKPGPCPTTNALKIMDMEGLPT